MQKTISPAIAVATFIVGIAIGYTTGISRPPRVPVAQAPVQNAMHIMPDGSMMDGAGHTMSMEDMMHSMNAALEGKTGDAFDTAFLNEMIIHHEGAVEMAQLALTNAKHKEIIDLAKAIITAQEQEISQMKDWRTQWYAGQ